MTPTVLDPRAPRALRGATNALASAASAARRPNDLLLRACRREKVERPPVWMMRQAGRYLPEFRAVRERADFLTMVRTPEIAAEVTLQPVELVGVDAAIIFSDILVIPEAMGLTLAIEERTGPRLAPTVRTADDVARLREVQPERDLAYVLDAIRLTRARLDARPDGGLPVIGFAGGPWTLAAYMIEGAGTQPFAAAKRLLLTQPRVAHELLARLAEAVGQHLAAQAAAGAAVLQLFESWGGALAPEEFRAFALPYLARAAEIARASGAPLVVFAPGCGWALDEIAEATGADVMGIDWHTEPEVARRLADRRGVAIQGNMDPSCLHAPASEVRMRTRRMLAAMDGVGYVANLGHGILPDVPVSGARAFVDAVQGWRSNHRRTTR